MWKIQALHLEGEVSRLMQEIKRLEETRDEERMQTARMKKTLEMNQVKPSKQSIF